MYRMLRLRLSCIKMSQEVEKGSCTIRLSNAIAVIYACVKVINLSECSLPHIPDISRKLWLYCGVFFAFCKAFNSRVFALALSHVFCFTAHLPNIKIIFKAVVH